MQTVATCQSLVEAQMLQSLLGGSGIEAFLPDEFTAQSGGLINALGGIRVQVPEDKITEAKEILAAMEGRESSPENPGV